MDMIRPLGCFFCMDILAGAIEQKKTYRPYYLPQGARAEEGRGQGQQGAKVKQGTMPKGWQE